MSLNSQLFLNIYRKYSNNQIDDVELKNILFEFILRNVEQFNGMFSVMFSFNIENFIKEIKINLVRKIKRMKIIERAKGILSCDDILDNIETALKSAFYMHFRHIYNNIEKYKVNKGSESAIFLFIRNFAYSGMFRYNSKGGFNVPYGGIGYNRKNFLKKVNYLMSQELDNLLSSTVIENRDFEDFFRVYEPTEKDFVFLDPPYDTEFSTYAKNEFNRLDQIRLSNYLINVCKAKWMLVIKNTEFIYNLYSQSNLNIKPFDKTYLVSFMNRNEKDVQHLLITNY